MSESVTIRSQIEHIRKDIPDTVRLIAVTKYVTAEAVKEAYEAGIRDFGESRIQDAQAKIQALSHLPGITWHFIGHLQSNKAKQATQLFDWIHSVDSLKLAQRLNRLAIETKTHPNICLQVKIRPDPDKYGWVPSILLQDLPTLQGLQQLNIRGLMIILPLGLSESEILASFHETRDLAASIRNHPQSPLPLTELSMGMSKDYPLAIAAGATMIRLGRILFPSIASR